MVFELQYTELKIIVVGLVFETKQVGSHTNEVDDLKLVTVFFPLCVISDVAYKGVSTWDSVTPQIS